MAGVVLNLRDGGRRVQLTLEDRDSAAAAELEHSLLLSGAVPRGNGFDLSVVQFRRHASEIAHQLRGMSVELDEGVEKLLRTQLSEVRSRQTVEKDLGPLSSKEVRERIGASGRFERPLTKEQIENLGALLALPHAANFSVPGAGKTATLLATYEALRGERRVDRLLVVAPKNAFISWEEEIEECYREDQLPNVSRLSGGQSGVAAALAADPEIVLVTYQLLANVSDLVKMWVERHRTQIVLDESHRIKSGWQAVTAASTLELADAAVRRDLLSGTPLPQAAEDLRAQLEFLWPGQRILPDVALPPETSREKLDEVAQGLRPLYVRTTKDELALPKLHVDSRPVELGALQRELYDALRSEAARVTSDMTVRDQRFFRALGSQVVRLLQAAVNPMLLTEGPLFESDALEPIPEDSRVWELLREIARHERPAKVEWVLNRTEELIGKKEKVLIWTQFVMNIKSLSRLLGHHGAVVLFGQVPTGDASDPGTREHRIQAFHNDDETRVMIANPAAAGEGISLHLACHNAIYLDRSFNAAHYLQSLDRIHRLGGPKGIEPKVEIPEAIDTIDERVRERLLKKVSAMSQVLNDPGLATLVYDDEARDEYQGGIEPEDVDPILEHLERGDG